MRVYLATDIISISCARYCAYHRLCNIAIARGYIGHIKPFYQGNYRFFSNDFYALYAFKRHFCALYLLHKIAYFLIIMAYDRCHIGLR